MEENTTYILITGANRQVLQSIVCPYTQHHSNNDDSGVGLATAKGVAVDFLSTRPPSQSLHLIIPTRSTKKSSETIRILKEHVKHHVRVDHGDDPAQAQRITFQAEALDLMSLLSVRALARRLLASPIPRIDCLILNAGIGGWYDLDWPEAVWAILTDPVQAVTYPSFYRAGVGAITPPQFPPIPNASTAVREAPPLARNFASNVFGHYVLVHEIMSLLRTSSSSDIPPTRIIWCSSTDSSTKFDAADLQGLRTAYPYSFSKRVTDLLSLTYHLPASCHAVKNFVTPPAALSRSSIPPPENHSTDTHLDTRPPIFLNAHPGISQTSIIIIPSILVPFWILALYLARWLGSLWHPVTASKAAFVNVFLALAPYSTITHMISPSGPEGGGYGKFGASTTRWLGTPRIRRTFVAGWGGGGHELADAQREAWGFGKRGWSSLSSGTPRGSREPRREDIEAFEVEGARVWEEMEKLRREWMDRCEEYERCVAELEGVRKVAEEDLDKHNATAGNGIKESLI